MKRQIFWLVLITAIAFVVRLYRVTSSPEGLYIDETSIGYNAYSLIETGKDEHGVSWPLFFEAFGEYKLPVYVYAVVLTQLLIGPTDLSVRLPAVLFGTFTIPFLYWWLKELFTDEIGFTSRVLSLASPNATHKGTPAVGAPRLVPPVSVFVLVPLVGAFLIALSPWHFQFTHAGFEASAGVFFLTVGLALFYWSVHKGSQFGLIVSLLSFVLSLYSYNSARIVIPIVGLTLFIAYRKQFSFIKWGSALLIAGLVSLPFWQFALSPQGLVRAQQVSILYEKTSVPIWKQFISNYWKNIDPKTLFVYGEPTIAHLTPHRMSLLYLVELPFFIAGLLFLLKRKLTYAPLIILLLVGFAPPALTTLNPHALRASLVIPATIAVSAMGFGWFVVTIKPRLKPIVVGGFVFLLSVSLLQFLTIYHGSYVKDAGWDWQVDIKRVADIVAKYQDQYDFVLFDQGGPAKVAYAWYLKMDPVIYQTVQDADRMGKYVFNASPELRFSKSLYISSQENVQGHLIETVTYPNNQPAQFVYELN